MNLQQHCEYDRIPLKTYRNYLEIMERRFEVGRYQQSTSSVFLTPETPHINSVFKPNVAGTKHEEAVHDFSSSVFLSPPDSNEKLSPIIDRLENELERIPKLCLEETEEDAVSGVTSPSETHFDILSCLWSSQIVPAVTKILEYLEPCDLQRLASSCRGHREIVLKSSPSIKLKREQFLMEKEKYYRSKGKENIGCVISKKPNDRPVLTTVTNTPLNRNVSEESLHEQRTPIIRTMMGRPCPNCQSPSRYYKNTSDRAICEECKFDFCCNCFHSYDGHNNVTPCSKNSLRVEKQSKSKKSANVGSKQSKSRLRRL